LKTPTERQIQVLRLLTKHPQPTLREMMESLGIGSTNGISDHLRALERKGYIIRPKPAKARCITITDKGHLALTDALEGDP
jgi:repressor LexA